MDRIMVYPGAIPLDTDILHTNLNPLLAIGNLADATIGVGGSTFVSNLVISPTSPASLSVEVGPGSIYTREYIDSVAYGSLGTNTSQVVIKQGINLGYTTFTLTPPTISGYTQLYLIQAQFLEEDVSPTVFNYYNSTPPYTPFSGPGGSGATQNALRTSIVSLQLVSTGTPYPTGSDPSATSGAVPALSSGWVGLYLIPVNNGQTQITSGQLANVTYPGAPFLPQRLSQQRVKLYASLTIPVSATGSDSWVAPSPFTPFLTLQKAWNYINNSLDLNGQSVTISVGPGTFAPILCSGQPLGGTTVAIVGSGSSTVIASSAYGTSAITANAGASISVSNLTVTASGSYASGISVSGGATVLDAGGIIYGACYTSHRNAYGGGNLIVGGNSTISGASAMHLFVTNGGSIFFSPGYTTTGSGALAFTQFASCGVGQINIGGGHTWSGMSSFTGQRYAASYGGAIITNTSGAANYFPGNAAGTNNSGTSYAGFYW